MLKTKFNDSIRLVTQPNHAVAAGYMASYWGNKGMQLSRKKNKKID